MKVNKDLQYFKFCSYGFLKNLRFFEPFIFLYLMDQGFSFSLIGGLFAIKEIALNFLEIPTGIVADLLGRKSSMLFSFLCYGIAFALFGMVQSYSAWIVVILIYAMGDAFRTGTHKAIIFDYLERTGQSELRKVYYGQTRSWSKIGSMVSVIIAAVLVVAVKSYRPIFWASAVMAVFGFLLILSYPGYLNGKGLMGNKKKWTKDNFCWCHLKDHILSIYKGTTLAELKLIGNTALPSGMYKGLKDYIQPLLMPFMTGVVLSGIMKNMNPSDTGRISSFFCHTLPSWNPSQKEAVLIGGAYLVIFAVAAFASRFSSKIAGLFKSDYSMLNISLVAGPLVFLAAGLSYHFNFAILVLLGYLIITGIENVRKPVGVATIGSFGKTETLASVLSVESQAESIFAAATVFGAGVFSDLLDSPGKGLMVMAATMLVTGLLFRLKGQKAIL